MNHRAHISRIAVVTDKDDGHLPFVAPHLDKQPVVLNIAEGAAIGRGFSFVRRPNGMFVLVIDGREVTNITGVWYRRPSLRSASTLPVPEHLRQYSFSALDTLERFVWSRFSDALWVSDPYAMHRANDKLVQLELAAKLGFHMPETIATSSTDEARKFIRQTGETITKAVGIRHFIDPEGVQRVVLTRKVDPAADLAGLEMAPFFFQQTITVVADIRATVVGDCVFAAVIRSSRVDEPSSSVRDWRMANFDEKMDIQPFDLPAKISRLCREHTRELGLVFGAIDLVLDNKGVFWFLENNPDGQWAFIENVTGQPIGKTIAEVLQSGKQ